MATNPTFELVHNSIRGDERGHDYHADCPFCGKLAQRGQTHFSYSYWGFKCFVCGARGGLIKLAKHLQCPLTELATQYTPKPKPPKARAKWLDNAGDLVTKYSAHPKRVALWQNHKPVSEDMIFSKNLGVGILPASRCKHRRLILPIYNDGNIVCLRGRAFECNCKKWLASGGWTLDTLPLWNLDALPVGGILWIVENPVDALLITPYTGAATLSTSYWRDDWGAAIVAKRPSLVVVAYDNDLPGNGGGWQRDEFIEEWQQKTGGKPIPEAQGIKLANKLRSIGLNAVLYDWKDSAKKSDVGTLLVEASAG